MHIAILGRQPNLGMAELESLYGPDATKWFSSQSAVVSTDTFSIDHLGGTQKAGRVSAELHQGDWHRVSMKIVQAYSEAWADLDGKLTLGISAYGFNVSAREVQKTGIVLKQKLKKAGVSLRLIPNTDVALNSATSHHNKLGLSSNKVELLVVRATNGRVVIAESIGAQNITAYAQRDQGRPKRDAFVGMLPPKLAQIMINLATPSQPPSLKLKAPSRSDISESEHLQPESEPISKLDITSGAKPFTQTKSLSGDQNDKTLPRILDPFCGTGVILQEAALMGYAVYGTDLADKMVEYSQTNLEWLASTHHVDIDATIHQGDAMTTTWQPPIDAVVCESYLGQPFSAPPSPAKLDEVRKNCNYIIGTFLKNIGGQLTPGTPLCIAIPAWRSTNGDFSHLSLTNQLEKLGFKEQSLSTVARNDLLYYREDQVVARELLLLTKA
ncbi:MAG TPA: methyltransferase domain-containing protein [Candidatus Saccharimonadales bacterium]|nr:methyltransferase domain-containing protein [Candidatus Saccharimonadales bacterium]